MNQVITIDKDTIVERPSDQDADDVSGHLWMLYAAGFMFGFAMGAGAAGAGYAAYEGTQESVTLYKSNKGK
ncbi:MAG: hypothetical protein ACRDJE_21685 [Dehalococcoidia bacterium]